MKETKCEMLFNSLDCYQMIFVEAKCVNILSCSYQPCLVACSGLRYMLSCVFVLFFFVLYLFSTCGFHLEYFSCTDIVAITDNIDHIMLPGVHFAMNGIRTHNFTGDRD